MVMFILIILTIILNKLKYLIILELIKNEIFFINILLNPF